LAPDRRQQILELIYQQGSAYVAQLSEKFSVSGVTIRGDLDWLAAHRLVGRARGGAVALPTQALAAAFSQRSVQNKEQKQRIARAALELLQPDETVVLDAGSTVYELSRLVSNGAGLTVVTPALNVAAQLVGLPGIELIIVGGRLDPHTLSTSGATAEQAILDIPAHRVFLGAHAVGTQGDVFDVSIEVARLKRAMVRAARHVILLADSSKWGSTGQARVAELSAIHTIVTDAGLPKTARRAVQAAGANLIVA